MSFYENFETHFRQSSNKRNALLFRVLEGEGISTWRLFKDTFVNQNVIMIIFYDSIWIWFLCIRQLLGNIIFSQISLSCRKINHFLWANDLSYFFTHVIYSLHLMFGVKVQQKIERGEQKERRKRDYSCTSNTMVNIWRHQHW